MGIEVRFVPSRRRSNEEIVERVEHDELVVIGAGRERVVLLGASDYRLLKALATEASLRQAFETWLQKVILPRFGLSQEDVSDTLTLEELETMLAESIDRWNRQIREEGRE
jgi:hypothetical protein